MDYESQLKYKAGILRETLQRVGKIELTSEITLHASPPWNYRNRTRLRVQTAPEFELGYYRFGSHEFLGVSECPISSPLINRVMARLVELGGCECPAPVEEIELFADAGDERLLAWAFCGRDADGDALLRWAERLREQVAAIVGLSFFSSRRRAEEETATDLKPLALGPQGLKPGLGADSGARLKPCPPGEIRYRAAGAEYRVSAGAFFQVNRHLVDELVAVATGNVSGESALDLYAGVGLFSTALAPKIHHIFAVEASQTSYADLVHNSPANVKTVRGRTEDYLRSRPARKRPDLVVLDPPRAGLGKAVARSLVELGAPRVRYVSCDPSTLARDLAPLLAAGYRIEEAHLFDLFPQTFHIESVMLLAR
jgi:23S rRNA (uracil1939-C5)-methyltransferase